MLREENMRPNPLFIANCFLPVTFQYRTAERAAKSQDPLVTVMKKDREVKVKVCCGIKELVP